MFGSDRPMASLIILVSRAPGGPDQGAGDHQDQVVQGEAVGRHGQAGQRVEQGDQHRGVGPADGQADPGAQARASRPRSRKPTRWGSAIVQAPSPTMATAAAAWTHMLAGEGDGPAGEQLLQLGEGHQAAGERGGPDDQAEDQFQHVQAARAGRAGRAGTSRWRPGRPPRRRPR